MLRRDGNSGDLSRPSSPLRRALLAALAAAVVAPVTATAAGATGWTIVPGGGTDPGNLSFNHDIDRCTEVRNGQRQPIATMCPDRVVFNVPVAFMAPKHPQRR